MNKLFEIATNISTPLALAGLVVMVVYAVIKQLLRSGIIPPLGTSAGGRTLNLILKGLFILAILAIVLGFAGYIVSLYTPQRTSQNLATKDDIAKLEELILALQATNNETREKASAFSTTAGERPPPEDFVASYTRLKQQLAEAQALIASLRAKSASLPADALTTIDTAHDTVRFAGNAVGMVSLSASVAAHLVRQQTSAQISKILGGRSLDDLDIAGWSYNIRAQRPFTKDWHFVDIPVGATSYDPSRDCPSNSCIVAAIENVRVLLVDHSTPPEQRTDALKMLIGLMSDLHRPLHCATRDNDKGANTVRVKLGSRTASLHTMWDSDLFKARVEANGITYLDTLLNSVTPEIRQREAKGSVADWAWESHQIAATVIYPEIPLNGLTTLTPDYISRHAKIIDLQVIRAGIRLAAVLDSALGI